MADLLRSTFGLAWSASLCGVGQVLGSLREAPEAGPLDAVSSLLRRRLGPTLGLLAQAGEELADDWIDRAAETLSPARWRTVGEETGRSVGEALRLVTGAAAGADVARRELAAKIAVWRLVKGVRGRLGLSAAGERFALGPALAGLAAVPAGEAAWALEGLGHDFVAAELAADPSVSGLLRGLELAPGPTLFLHAGLGLAAAEQVLEPLPPGATSTATAAALARFEDLCRRNAEPPLLDVALESLGLVARCFYPELVRALDRAIDERRDPRLAGLFWHGVGRGLYFVPSAFVPGHVSAARALARARREGTREAARRDAEAGVAYAVVFVHLRDPEVVEDLLRRARPLLGSSFTSGAASALALRRRLDGDADVAGFLAHCPTDPATAAAWAELLATPAVMEQGGRG